jgi:hypothetical protein
VRKCCCWNEKLVADEYVEAGPAAAFVHIENDCVLISLVTLMPCQHFSMVKRQLQARRSMKQPETFIFQPVAQVRPTKAPL